MAVIYVTDQGATVNKVGQRIVVQKQGKHLHSVPSFNVEQVVLFGNVQLSPQVRSFLLDEAIDTVFLSTAGKFRGRLWAGEGKNVELRRTQFRCYEDAAFGVELARRIVRGKLQNCRTVLRRHQRTLQDTQVESALARIRSAISRLERAGDVDEVRGYEGAAAAAYFGCFGKLISQPGFSFSVRNRRPPRDPVNALLSFGYTLLLGTITAAVQTVGLDPYLGSLHATENGKPSLVLDLMEEFRPLLVDAIVLKAINKRQITPSDFLQREDVALPDGVGLGPGGSSEVDPPPSRDEYPVLLRQESLRTWILTYEAALRNRVSYSRLGLNMTWRQVCLEQARLLARHIKGDECYEPFVVR